MSGMKDAEVLAALDRDAVDAKNGRALSVRGESKIVAARLRGEAQTGRCAECGEDEPRTGACGSSSPRALCNRPQAALSSTAAPEAGKVVVREAALRLAIRELNLARKGVESAGRANYVHRLLLAMLGEEPIHDATEPAAPAPVAGDAVARAREILAAQYDRSGAPSAARAVRDGALSPVERGDIIPAIVAALAQDRASQAGAVPDAVRAEHVARLSKLRDDWTGLLEDYPAPCASRDEVAQELETLKYAVAALAAQPSGGGVPGRDWPRIANEWADMATSSIDGLKNIRDGISTVDEVLANTEQMLAHCRKVNDAAPAAPETGGEVRDVE